MMHYLDLAEIYALSLAIWALYKCFLDEVNIQYLIGGVSCKAPGYVSCHVDNQELLLYSTL